MTLFNLKPLTIAALLAMGATPALASPQSDTMMMVGTQNYTPAAVVGCTAYFQSLADGAVARGTFAVSTPQVGVVLSTSGAGG